jgi:hypothetical protein
MGKNRYQIQWSILYYIGKNQGLRTPSNGELLEDYNTWLNGELLLTSGIAYPKLNAKLYTAAVLHYALYICNTTSTSKNSGELRKPTR